MVNFFKTHYREQVLSIISRLIASLVAACSILILLILFNPQLAQAAPATPAEMNLYTRIAAVNACIARSAGIDFDKAVGAAGETIAQVIFSQHQGLIQQVGKKSLTLDELRKGSINSAVIGAYEICPKQVPPDVAVKVQDAFAEKIAGSK